jgi:hypothetical protein
VNDAIFMLLDGGGVGDQLRSESVHLAFVAFVGGIGILSSILSWLLRRDLKRRDDDSAKTDFKIACLDEKLDNYDRRHGCEISDIKIAVAPLFVKAELPSPNYPTR